MSSLENLYCLFRMSPLGAGTGAGSSTAAVPDAVVSVAAVPTTAASTTPAVTRSPDSAAVKAPKSAAAKPVVVAPVVAASPVKPKYVPKPVEDCPRRLRGPLPGGLRPIPGARNVLVTSALPYVNNVPHLGNIIGCVLSADVYARYARARGWNTLYVCGTDEYGTATENKAAEEKLTPRAICDKYHALHASIYSWFDIAFNHFGRTSTADPQADKEWPHTQVCGEIFKSNVAAGNVCEDSVEQVFCLSCEKFLADRFIEGTCPLCGYDDARGDQCDGCGKLLSATDLVRPACKAGKLAGGEPHRVEIRTSRHLFLDLPKLQPALEGWFAKASAEGAWSENAIQVTRAWLRDGLKPRCITRDLKWGTPVPYAGFENKVFYVWFDAPIGYVSITANYSPQHWREWWGSTPVPGADVKLYQFMGKDNIPFHTVIFPASLIGANEPWTILHHVNTTEYLNYESGKFSKSRSVGVFGDTARETGIPSEVWRYYLLALRPEASDAVFSWSDFADRTNNELLKNPGNLVNRALAFAHTNCGGCVPPAAAHEPREESLIVEIDGLLDRYHEAMEAVRLKLALKIAMEISAAGNVYMQDCKPWELKVSAPARCATVINTIASLIRVVAAVLEPFMPGFADKVAFILDLPHLDMPLKFNPGASLIPVTTDKGHPINRPTPVFSAISEEQVASYRAQFGGASAANSDGIGPSAVAPTPAPAAAASKSAKSKADPKQSKVDLSTLPPFARVDLRVGLITKVWPHPEADGLWCEEVDVGEPSPRLIASGLRAFYTAEQMLGRRICVVCNLKPRTMRGFASAGMVLCASNADRSIVEFVDPPVEANVGERLTCEGVVPADAPFPVPEVINPAKEGNPWTIVSGELRTDASRVATFGGLPLSVRGYRASAPSQASAPIG